MPEGHQRAGRLLGKLYSRPRLVGPLPRRAQLSRPCDRPAHPPPARPSPRLHPRLQVGGSGVLVQPMTYIFDEEPARWSHLLESLGITADGLNIK